MKHVQTRTAAPTTDKRERQEPGRSQDTDGQRLYEVPLTAADVQLIQACSSWICRLGPSPDIRARLVHLERQLAGARPAR